MSYDPPAAPPPLSLPHPALLLDRSCYAHWGRRVGARLVDTALAVVTLIPLLVLGVAGFGTTQTGVVTSSDGVTSEQSTTSIDYPVLAAFIVCVLLVLAFNVWNELIRQGRRGCTVGKSLFHITVVKESTGQPTGVWLALGRQLLHAADGALFCLGYFWPLWDKKRQTFADKIVETVVLDTRSR